MGFFLRRMKSALFRRGGFRVMLGVVASLVLQLSGGLERTCFPGAGPKRVKETSDLWPPAGRLVKASREQTKGLTSSGKCLREERVFYSAVIQADGSTAGVESRSFSCWDEADMARGPSKGYPYPSSSMVCDSWLFRAYFPHGWRREVDDTKQDVPLRGNGNR